MKKSVVISVVVLAAVLVGGLAFAGNPIATGEEVRQFFDKYADCYIEMDIEGFKALFSSGAVQKKNSIPEDISEVYTKFFNKSRELHYHLLGGDCKIYDNAVMVKGSYEILQIVKGGKKNIWTGKISWRLEKEDGVLRVISLDYSPD